MAQPLELLLLTPINTLLPRLLAGTAVLEPLRIMEQHSI